MNSQMVVIDPSSQYAVQEFGPIVVAIALVIALGGVVAATIVLCGWHGAKAVMLDWLHGKATIECK